MNHPGYPTYYMSMRRQRFLLFRVYKYQDADAYAELYDIYYERIRRFVYFKLPKPVVDETSAEVFLRAWEYATASSVDNAAALFYRIARNLIADHYRKHGDQQFESIDSHEFESNDDVEKSVEGKLESEKLLMVLKELKSEYQEVIMMRYLDDMNISEIASATGKTSNNIRVTLHRAKKALKDAATQSN